MTKKEFTKRFMATRPKYCSEEKFGSGILTKQQAEQYVKIHGSINVIEKRILPFGVRSVYYFPTIIYTGISFLGNEWRPSNIEIPHDIIPRKSLPSGIVETLDDYITIYHKDDLYIESLDELYEFLYGKNKLTH